MRAITILIPLSRYKFAILKSGMEKYFLGILVLGFYINSNAQTLQLASARTIDTNKTSETAIVVKNQHLIPFFGETSKSLEQIELEIKFLSECDQNFESRKEASKFFSDRGWNYLQDSELDTACYRFNLAWLLDNKK